MEIAYPEGPRDTFIDPMDSRYAAEAERAIQKSKEVVKERKEGVDGHQPPGEASIGSGGVTAC